VTVPRLGPRRSFHAEEDKWGPRGPAPGPTSRGQSLACTRLYSVHDTTRAR